jgi:hypothetical protein
VDPGLSGVVLVPVGVAVGAAAVGADSGGAVLRLA